MADSSNKRLDARIDEIELRLRMATPGPWEAPPYRTAPDGPASYNAVTSEHANICGLHDGGQTRERIDANAQFIANAPSDVAALIAEVRRLRADAVERPGVERLDAPAATLAEALRQILNRCPDCGGSGVIHRHRWFTNEIPEGHECEICAECDRCGLARAALSAADEASPGPAVERLVAALEGLLVWSDLVMGEMNAILGPEHARDEIAPKVARAALAEFGEQPTGDEP